MTIHILNEQNTILNTFLAELRDKNIQQDPMRFRRNLERIGEITAYELSKELNYAPKVVETPLGEAEVQFIDDHIVVATSLRAGLPFHQGTSTTSTMRKMPSFRPIARTTRMVRLR